MAFDPDYDLAAAAAAAVTVAAAAATTGVFHVKNFTVAVPHRSETAICIIHYLLLSLILTHQQKH